MGEWKRPDIKNIMNPIGFPKIDSYNPDSNEVFYMENDTLKSENYNSMIERFLKEKGNDTAYRIQQRVERKAKEAGIDFFMPSYNVGEDKMYVPGQGRFSVAQKATELRTQGKHKEADALERDAINFNRDINEEGRKIIKDKYFKSLEKANKGIGEKLINKLVFHVTNLESLPLSPINTERQISHNRQLEKKLNEQLEENRAELKRLESTPYIYDKNNILQRTLKSPRGEFTEKRITETKHIINKLEVAKDLSELAEKSYEAGNTKEGLKAFWKGITSGKFIDNLPFSISDLGRDIGVVQLLKRKTNGESLSPYEESVVTAYQALRNIEEGVETPFSYEIAKGVRDMATFMVEFIGTSSVSSLVKGGIRKIARYSGEQAGRSLAKKATDLAIDAAAYSAGTFAQTLSNPQMLAKNWANLELQNYKFTEDPDGTTIEYIPERSIAGQIWKTAAMSWQEIFSEGLLQGAGKIIPGNKFSDFINKAKWSNPIFEWVEENAGDVFEGIITGDIEHIKNIADSRQQIILIGTVALTGGAMQTGTSINQRINNAKINTQLNIKGQKLSSDVKTLLDDAINSFDRTKADNAVAGLMSIPEEQRGNAIDYFAGKMSLKGQEIGDESAVKELIGEFVNKDTNTVQTAQYAGQDGYFILGKYWDNGTEMTAISKGTEVMNIPSKTVKQTGEYEKKGFVNSKLREQLQGNTQIKEAIVEGLAPYTYNENIGGKNTPTYQTATLVLNDEWTDVVLVNPADIDSPDGMVRVVKYQDIFLNTGEPKIYTVHIKDFEGVMIDHVPVKTTADEIANILSPAPKTTFQKKMEGEETVEDKTGLYLRGRDVTVLDENGTPTAISGFVQNIFRAKKNAKGEYIETLSIDPDAITVAEVTGTGERAGQIKIVPIQQVKIIDKITDRTKDKITDTENIYSENSEFIEGIPKTKKGNINITQLSPEQLLRYSEIQGNTIGNPNLALSVSKEKSSDIEKEINKKQTVINGFSKLSPIKQLELSEKIPTIKSEIAKLQKEKAFFDEYVERSLKDKLDAMQYNMQRKNISQKNNEKESQIEREKQIYVPDVSKDVAVNARNRGFRVENGNVIKRQKEIIPEHYIEAQRKFSNRDIIPVKHTVIEAEIVQPSHTNGQRNMKFFITEAQPKERTDNASIAEVIRIANNMNPLEITVGVGAYEGAPVVNSRGEVIQGNNRSAALKEMYRNNPEVAQRYKQYLEDHAADYGITAEQVAEMKAPVVVDIAEITDNEAIRLGQMEMGDMESGGIQRINPQKTAEKLADNTINYANILLLTEIEEQPLGDIIRENAKNALKYLYIQKNISETQHQSAFNKNGEVTPEAVRDLRDILSYLIFKEGNDNIKRNFETLPDKAKKALLQTAFRNLKNPESIMNEIQASIEIYASLAGELEGVTDGKKINSIANDWYRQRIIDWNNPQDGFINSEKYSNFSLELAKRYKANTQKLQAAQFNQLYDYLQGKGGNIFEKAQTLPLPEAIKEVYNIEYKPIINEKNSTGSRREQSVHKDGSNIVSDIRQQGMEGRSDKDNNRQGNMVGHDGSRKSRSLDDSEEKAHSMGSNDGRGQTNVDSNILRITDEQKAAQELNRNKEGLSDLDTGTVRYQTVHALEAVNAQFNAELQQQIDGTLSKGHIYRLGNPSVILQSAGIPDLPIEMAASRLSNKSMQENHPFELSEIKDFPQAIQNPLAVFRSATHIGSYVILTEIEHKGKNYVVAIETNRKRGKIEINSIRSVHYRNSNAHITNWIEEGLLEYADKQKLKSWINKQRYNSADVANPTRNSARFPNSSNPAEVRKLYNHAAKIVQNFENPVISDNNFQKSSIDKFKPISSEEFNTLIERLKQTGLAKDVITDPIKMRKVLEDYFLTENIDIALQAWYGGNSRTRNRWDNSGYTEREDSTKVSVRALEAESDGTFTAGQFRKVYGVAKKDFDLLVDLGIIVNNEWHHTGKSFKESDFYSWSDSQRNGGSVEYFENGEYNNELVETSLAEIYTSNKKEISKLAKELESRNWEYQQKKKINYVPSFDVFIEQKYPFREHNINDYLTPEEISEKARQNNYISEQWETMPNYERRLEHERINGNYRNIAEERRNEEVDKNRSELEKEYNDNYGKTIQENKSVEEFNINVDENNQKTSGKEKALLDIAEKFNATGASAYNKVANISEEAQKAIDETSKKADKEQHNQGVRARIQSAEKDLSDWIEDNIANGKITQRTRILKEPANFIRTAQEMNGKYGWFDSSYKSYNLTEYYSGLEFSSKELLDEYWNKKKEINDIQSEIRFMSTSNGDVYGFVTDDGTVYIDPSKMNANTPIHEFGHLWNSFIKENNKGLWEKGVELIKKSKYWEGVNDDPNYAHLNDERKADEAIARAIGDKGEQVVGEKGVGEKLLEWIKEAWEWIWSKLGISNLSLEQFTEGAVADLLSGKPVIVKQKAQEYFKTNPDRLPLTLSVFERAEFKAMRGKEINPVSIQQQLNKSGIKAIEKQLINDVIENSYKGKKSVSYDELEAKVRATIIPLDRIQTSSYANYGLENLNEERSNDEEYTLILNFPTIEHNKKGHFYGDFETKNQRKANYIPKQLDNNTWVAVEENYPEHANENNIYQFVGTAGSKESVEQWIESYNNADANEPLNVGMYGHIRVWKDGDRMFIPELQSDFFQKRAAKKYFVEGSNEYIDLFNDTKRKRSEIAGKAVQKLQDYSIKNNVLLGSNEFLDYKSAVSIFNENTPLTDGFESDFIAFVKKTKSETDKELKNIDKQLEKKREEIYEGLSPEEKQFIASQKVWERRLLHEAVREAAQSGSESVLFPTPYTLAVIEGYVSAKGDMPYEIVRGGEDGQLRTDDIIEHAGERYIVGESGYLADGFTAYPLREAIEDTVSSYANEEAAIQMEGLLYDVEMGIHNPEAMTREELENTDFGGYWETAKEILLNEIEHKEHDIENNNEFESEEALKQALSEATVSFDDYYDEIKERVYDEIYDRIDEEYFTKELGYGKAIITRDGTIYVWKEEEYGESFEQPSYYEGNASKEDFDPSDLSDTQQRVLEKYQEYESVLKEDYGEENVILYKDGDGYDWVQVELNKNTQNRPVVAFQHVGEEEILEQIHRAELATDTHPTEAQKKAGNYKKGHVKIQGFDISIEQPKGSVRIGVDENGRAWETTMNNTYGYFVNTEGRDSDHIDVFIGNKPLSTTVFVVDQINPETGEFDEHKVMLGFETMNDARESYLSNYEKGWQGLGNITSVELEDFRDWATKDGARKKAFSEYKHKFPTAKELTNSSDETDPITGVRFSIVHNPNAARQQVSRTAKIKEAINRLEEGFSDNTAPLVRWEKQLEKTTGKKLSISEKPSVAINILSSRQTAQMEKFQKNFYIPMAEQIRKVQDETGATQQDQNIYLQARHAKERNKNMRRKHAAKDVEIRQLKNKLSIIDKALNEAINTTQQDKITTLTSQKHKKKKEIDVAIENLYQELVKEDVVFSGYSDKESDMLMGLFHQGWEEKNMSKFREAYNMIIENKTLENRIKQYYDKKTTDKKQYNADVKKLAENKKTLSGIQYNNISIESMPKEYHKWSDTIIKATDFILDTWIEGGRITAEEYKQYKKDAPFYVPLRNWNITGEFEDDIRMSMMDNDKLFDQLRTSLTGGFRQAKGRKSIAGDVFENITIMANTAIMQMEKNKFRQKMAALLSENPTKEARMLKYWVRDDGVDENGNPKYNYKSDEDKNAALKELNDTATAPERKKAIQKELSEYKNKPVYYSGNLTRLPQDMKNRLEVEVWIGGKAYTMQFTDYKLADVVSGLSSGKPVKYIGSATRLFSMANTQLSASFAISNAIRDFQFAFMSTLAEHDAKTAFLLVKNLSALREIFKENFGLTPGQNQIREYLNEFIENGGRTGYSHLDSPLQFARKLKRDINRLDRSNLNPSKWIQKGFEIITQLAETSEDMTRVAMYITMRKTGKNITESISAAKEVTVNFNRKGNFRGIGALYAFFNARVQGVMRYGRLFIKHPKKMLAVSAGYFIVGFLKQALMDFVLGEDDDEGERRTSGFLSYNYITIPSPSKNKYISIPLPHGFEGGHALGAMAYDLWKGKIDMKEFAAESVNTLIGQYSPVDFGEFLHKEDGRMEGRWSVLAPSISQPILQLFENRNFFGAKIRPESFNEKTTARRSLYHRNTLEMYKSTANIWFYIFGGDMDGTDIFKRGASTDKVARFGDMSPNQIQHVFENQFGAAGKFISRSVALMFEAASSASNKDIKDIKDKYTNFIPAYDRFVRSYNTEGYAQDYYDNVREAEDIKAKWKALQAKRNTYEYYYKDAISKGQIDNIIAYKIKHNNTVSDMKALIEHYKIAKYFLNSDIKKTIKKMSDLMYETPHGKLRDEIYDKRKSKIKHVNTTLK